MKLNTFGKIVESTWRSLPNHHMVQLDQYVIMPNHVHGIISISPSGGSRPLVTGGSRPAPTLGTIIGLFKSECTKQIRQTCNNPNRNIWQRNYHEHIIRNEFDLHRIQGYIQDNPANWEQDNFHPLHS